MTSSQETVHVIGGGLAGSEAAWQLARAGVRVVLHEMRPDRTTSAHKTVRYAELVCSNSFRSDDREHNAVGLLHEEMRRLVVQAVLGLDEPYRAAVLLRWFEGLAAQEIARRRMCRPQRRRALLWKLAHCPRT